MPDELKDRDADKEGKRQEGQKGLTAGLNENFPPSTVEATRQAINLLNITSFFNDNNKSNLKSIFKKLDECDRYAQASAEFNGDMMFIAMSLPIVSAIIHIASDRGSLKNATDWVVKHWKDDADKDPDKVAILSALILIYLASEGWQTFKTDPKQRETWKRIIERVKKLSTDTFDDD